MIQQPSFDNSRKDMNHYHVCFISRRYSGFECNPHFMTWIRTQYFWILQNGYKCIQATFIFGSDVDKKVSTELGTAFFVKDIIRNNIVSHSINFSRSSRAIIEDCKPDVLIFHGLNDILSHAFLLSIINKKYKTIIQDHGNVYRSKYRLLTFLFSKFNQILFNSPGQEEHWVSSNTLSQNKIDFVPEGSSFFKIKDKIEARKQTKLEGSPLLLWIGNLDSNKDPFTILKAINVLKINFPNIRIYFIYRKENLLKKIQEFIRENRLEEQVILLGAKTHEQIEWYLNSADYFILGSAKEGSGYSVIEAMACSTIPILSDIPSFKDFTNNDKLGALFKQGDYQDLIKKATILFNKNLEEQQIAVNDYFEKNYSPNALGRKLIEVCNKITI